MGVLCKCIIIIAEHFLPLDVSVVPFEAEF